MSSLVGIVCLKLAGRDSNRFCVILEEIDSRYVLIDGDVRRKKCSLRHLKLLPQKVKVSKSSSTEEVRKVLMDAGVPLHERKKRHKEQKEKKEKPVTERVKKSFEQASKKVEHGTQKKSKKITHNDKT